MCEQSHSEVQKERADRMCQYLDRPVVLAARFPQVQPVLLKADLTIYCKKALKPRKPGLERLFLLLKHNRGE